MKGKVSVCDDCKSNEVDFYRWVEGKDKEYVRKFLVGELLDTSVKVWTPPKVCKCVLGEEVVVR